MGDNMGDDTIGDDNKMLELLKRKCEERSRCNCGVCTNWCAKITDKMRHIKAQTLTSGPGRQGTHEGHALKQ